MNEKRVKSLDEEHEEHKSPYFSSIEWEVYPKDSFERFGDDLSEVLLSYLSFEDKFRFECVSKQFQRLIFNKQTDLIFDSKIKKKFEKLDVFEQKYIEFNTMSHILKKCSNIRRIVLSFRIKSMDGFISLVTKHCLHLNSIELNFHQMSENRLKEFCDKFGPKMKSIAIKGSHRMNSIKTILKRSPHLESLDIKDLNRRLSIVFNPNTNKPFAKKLKSFSFTFKSTDIKLIESFFDYYKNSLESVEVKTTTLSTEYINALMTQISKLSKLKKLVLICETSVESSFVNKFSEIVDKCPNIKELKLSFNQIVCPLIPKFLVLFNRFQQLKRLTFINMGPLPDPPVLHSLMSRDLIGCKQLTHLRIFSKDVLITDEFFENIDKYLPKLQSIAGKGFLTNNSLELLSKVLNLKRMALESNEPKFKVNKIFIKNLVTNCRKLQSIRLSTNSQIIYLEDFQISQLRRKDFTDFQIKIFQFIYGFYINCKNFSFL